MLRRTMLFLGLVAIGLIGGSAIAQETKTGTEKNFSLSIDYDRFKKTEIGEALIAIAKEQAKEAIDRSSDDGEVYEKVIEALGFDPNEELERVVIATNDIENPLRSAVAVVHLRTTTGNLEGLVLGLDGYETTKHGKTTIHSASAPEVGRAYGAIHKASSGKKSIVLAESLDVVTEMLDQLAANPNASQLLVGGTVDEQAFMHLNVLQIPMEGIGDGPQANVAKLIRGIKLSIGEANEQLKVHVQVSTAEDEQAEQLRQIVEGGRAMLNLAASQDDDEDLARMAEVVKGVVAESNDHMLELHLAIPTRMIMDFAREEMDLPF